MKLIRSILVLALLSVFFTVQVSGAEVCEKYKGVKKVWWDGVELKGGQIGRLSILNDTPLFKLEGDKKVFSRTLKAGEGYRIYAFKPGMLSVGGGFFVDRDKKVKYETPSKSKLTAALCVHNPHLLEPITKPSPESKDPTEENSEIPLKEFDKNEEIDATNMLINFSILYKKQWFIFDNDSGLFRILDTSLNMGYISTPNNISRNENFIYSASLNKAPEQRYDLFIHSINEPSPAKIISHIDYFAVNKNNLFTVEKEADPEKSYVFSLYQFNLDGTNKKLLKEDLSIHGGRPLEVKANDQYFYYRSGNSLKRIQLQTLEETDIPNINVNVNSEVNYLNEYIVVKDYKGAFIKSPISIYNYSGERLHLFNSTTSPSVISKYNNKLYFYNYGDDSVYKLNSDGNDIIYKKLNASEQFLGFKNGFIYTIEYLINDVKIYKYQM
ncbi:hypothetical protein [Jeotgalibacillus sp. R-1-5s-1]|uniref:hypothetical protein n=1 Tax=Jeotgalibacillus sp. R-1-5s-1 TaxID=2555897 RepID=UPI001FC8CD66|nr:hypothetical protein [Jeotgalibacillus sp. R-1-5s-1]